MKIFNFIRNLWRLLSIKPDKLSKLIKCADNTEIVYECVLKVSKIQDIHNEIIGQVAVNQYNITSTQGRIITEIVSIQENLHQNSKSVEDSIDFDVSNLFHNEDDDDIFH